MYEHINSGSFVSGKICYYWIAGLPFNLTLHTNPTKFFILDSEVL